MVWLSASLLDYCVAQLVVNMGIFVNSTSASGTQTAWQIMRDLANIGIIGGLVATAIATILQIQNYSANKLLARLIIAALLVNFSYFFAGAIIDSSNYLATAVYNDMTTAVSGCSTAGSCTLTSEFMQVTNFQSLHDDMTSTNSPSSLASTSSANLGPWMTVLVDILSIVLS